MESFFPLPQPLSRKRERGALKEAMVHLFYHSRAGGIQESGITEPSLMRVRNLAAERCCAAILYYAEGCMNQDKKSFPSPPAPLPQAVEGALKEATV